MILPHAEREHSHCKCGGDAERRPAVSAIQNHLDGQTEKRDGGSPSQVSSPPEPKMGQRGRSFGTLSSASAAIHGGLFRIACGPNRFDFASEYCRGIVVLTGLGFLRTCWGVLTLGSLRGLTGGSRFLPSQAVQFFFGHLMYLWANT